MNIIKYMIYRGNMRLDILVDIGHKNLIVDLDKFLYLG